MRGGYEKGGEYASIIEYDGIEQVNTPRWCVWFYGESQSQQTQNVPLNTLQQQHQRNPESLRNLAQGEWNIDASID